eukprot:gene19074-biopygen10004
MPPPPPHPTPVAPGSRDGIRCGFFCGGSMEVFPILCCKNGRGILSGAMTEMVRWVIMVRRLERCKSRGAHLCISKIPATGATDRGIAAGRGEGLGWEQARLPEVEPVILWRPLAICGRVGRGTSGTASKKWEWTERCGSAAPKGPGPATFPGRPNLHPALMGETNADAGRTRSGRGPHDGIKKGWDADRARTGRARRLLGSQREKRLRARQGLGRFFKSNRVGRAGTRPGTAGAARDINAQIHSTLAHSTPTPTSFVWLDLCWFEWVLCGLVGVWCGSVWFGLFGSVCSARLSSARFGSVLFGLVCLDRTVSGATQPNPTRPSQAQPNLSQHNTTYDSTRTQQVLTWFSPGSQQALNPSENLVRTR